MSAYDWLNDIQPDTNQQQETQNQLQRATTIESDTSGSSYFKWLGADVLSALTFGLISPSNTNFDVLGNQDETVAGSIAGLLLTIPEGGLISKLADASGNLIKKSAVSFLYRNGDKLTRKLLENSAVSKIENDVINNTLRTKLFNTSKDMIALSTYSALGASGASNYVDEYGNVKEERADPFTKEWFANFTIQSIPAILPLVGAKIKDIYSLKNTEDMVNKIQKNDFTSALNLNSDEEFESLHTNINNILKTKFSLEEPTEHNIEEPTHTITYDIIDNNKEYNDVHLLSDDKTYKHSIEEINNIKSAKIDNSEKIEQIKNLLDKASFSFNKINDADKTIIAKDILNGKTEELQKIANEDNKLKIISKNIKHNSKILGNIELKKVVNNNAEDIIKENTNLVASIKEAIKNNDEAKIKEIINKTQNISPEEKTKIIDSLMSKDIDTKTKINFIDKILELSKPNKYFLKQNGDYITLGFFNTKNPINNKPLAVPIKKINKNIYHLHNLDKETKTNIINLRNKELLKTIANAIHIISKNKELIEKQRNKEEIYERILEKSFDEIKKEQMDYHIVKDIPLTISGSYIEIENLTDTALEPISDSLKEAINDFITANIGDTRHILIELNKYSKENLSMQKRTTLGTLLKIAYDIKNGNIDYSMFDRTELKELFGKDFSIKLKEIVDEVNKHLSKIDDTIDLTLKNIFDIDDINIADKEAIRIISTIENPEILNSVIENFSKENPDVNNLLSSLVYKDKNDILHFKEEFKDALKIATKKVLYSALSTIDKRTIHIDKQQFVTYLFLKENNINPDNFYQNIIKKTIDILGITSPNVVRFDKLKNDMSNILSTPLGSDNILKRIFNPINLEPTAIEQKLSLSNKTVPFMILEKVKKTASESFVNLNKTNSQYKNVSMHTGSSNIKIEYKINGINVNEQKINNILNNFDNVKSNITHTYFNDFLKLNDLLEPIDEIDNFIKNKDKLISIRNVNEYLSKKSVALLNKGEKYIATLMANTEIKFRNDEIESTLDSILREKFDKFNNFIRTNDVNLFKELYKFFEMNDNLQLEIDIDKFKTIDDIKEFFGSKFDSIIEKIGEFKREYDTIKDFKNAIIEEETKLKVFMSESGRFMYDGRVSYQSNKWSKHFLDFTSAKQKDFKDINEAKTFLMSAIRTAIDEIDYKPENEQIRNKFITEKGKFDTTKSNNSNFKDHLLLLEDMITNIEPSELTASQIRYYYPLLKISEELSKTKHLTLNRLNKIINESKPIVEIDGSQNVAGTINALLSITDNATGINGHQSIALEDTYEKFLNVAKNAMNKSLYSDILKKLMSDIKRNHIKKPSQAFIYGQSAEKTAESIIKFFIERKLFSDELSSETNIGIARLNMLYDILFSNEKFKSLIPKDLLSQFISESKKIIDKLQKIKLINDAVEKGLNDVQSLNNVLDLVINIYNGNKNAVIDDLSKFGIIDKNYITNLNEIVNEIINDQNLKSKFVGYIGKLNSAISSSISNKDYLETIGLKATSSLNELLNDIKDKISQNPELKIVYYKTIIDAIKKTEQINKGKDLFDYKILNIIYDEIDKDLINEDYINSLSSSITKKTNFSYLLRNELENIDDYFKKMSYLRDTIENIYKVGESITLLKLNEKIEDPELILKRIIKEIKIDKTLANNIFKELKEMYILNDRKPTFKELGDILFRNGISPLRSETFIKESQIPFMQTPSGRKLLFITEKAVNLDKKTGMQGNGFAIINKPLTYFIQGIESDSLSKASMVSYLNGNIEGIIHRFDAVYGKEALDVSKNLNKMYGAMFMDVDFFERIKNQVSDMLSMLNKYKDTPDFEQLAEDVAKMKLLINEGKLQKGANEKIQILKKAYLSFFENEISTKYKFKKDGSLDLDTKTKNERILNRINYLKQIKKQNLESIDDTIHINQFTNGLKYFEESIKKGVC